MSFEESVLLHLMGATNAVGLEAVVIGNAAALAAGLRHMPASRAASDR